LQRDGRVLHPNFADLRSHFADERPSLREQILRNPALVIQIMTEFAQGNPQSAGYLTENPQLFLDVFDIRPAEFLEAVNGIRMGPPPPSEADLVAQFLANLTPDDFFGLERVMTTNVPLNIAIPIFVRHHKDVEATIEQINRMYPNRDTH
jgi:hypothetical protein